MYLRPYSDTLCHYGVKGMRWGIRRKRNSQSSNKNSGKNRSKKIARNVAIAASVVGSLYVYDKLHNYGLGSKLVKELIGITATYANAAKESVKRSATRKVYDFLKKKVDQKRARDAIPKLESYADKFIEMKPWEYKVYD